jgi:hypothetical protein
MIRWPLRHCRHFRFRQDLVYCYAIDAAIFASDFSSRQRLFLCCRCHARRHAEATAITFFFAVFRRCQFSFSFHLDAAATSTLFATLMPIVFAAEPSHARHFAAMPLAYAD